MRQNMYIQLRLCLNDVESNNATDGRYLYITLQVVAKVHYVLCLMPSRVRPRGAQLKSL